MVAFMINKISPTSPNTNNQVAFKSKIKFVDFQTFIKHSAYSSRIGSSDIFCHNMARAPKYSTSGIGPCVAICINGKNNSAIHIRPFDINQESSNQISHLIEEMGGDKEINNCLIIGGQPEISKDNYLEILNIAINKFENLKNKITLLCGQKDPKYSTNLYYDKKKDTYLLNTVQSEKINLQDSMVKSQAELEDFYDFRHIAPGDEVEFES